MNFVRRLIVGIGTPLLLTVTSCTPDSTSGIESGVTTTTVEPGTIEVIAIGDSQAAGGNDPNRGKPWSERLGAKVFNGANNNQGSGYVVLGAFMKRNMAEQLSYALGQAPQATSTIVMAGINDLQSQSVSAIEDGITLYSGLATANGLNTYIVNVIPSGAQSYTQAFEDKRVAVNEFIETGYGAQSIDCETSLDTDGDGQLDPEFILGDGLDFHLNTSGEQALAACITNAVGSDLGL